MTGTRESLVWGLVGALSFLVLAQAYRLTTDEGPALPALLAVAAGVLVAATLLARVVGPRLQKRRV